MASKEICCICLESVKVKEKPYNCNHCVHIKCAKQWNKNCPLCKSDFKIISVKKKYTFSISPMFERQLNVNNYKSSWKSDQCNSNIKKHNVEFSRSGVSPYGVLGKCSCGIIQSFNFKN